MAPRRLLQALLGLSLAACSSSSGEPQPTGTNGPVGPAPTGTVSPPNGAQPVRCDTASASVPCSDDPDPCGLNSGYPGDEYCVLPPPEGQGIQIHFGPKSYTDPAEIAKYALQPGEEFNAYGIAHVPTTEDHFYNYVQIRMRPGSHHLINTVVEGTALPEGFGPAGMGCGGTTLSGFPGTQNLVREMPPGGKQAPENVGLGSMLRGNTSLCLNHHAYNYNAKVQIREVWINVWFVPESEVTQRTSPVTITAGPFQPIQPHSQKVLTASATISGTGRIISLFGHRHAWTDRFAVWHNEDLIYDSWDWEESAVFDYDSITTNPAPDPAAKADGAISGILNVVPDDTIKIECDINNTSDNTLTFRNELYTGEMCILFGSAVGVSVGGIPRIGGTMPAAN
jgi:hypothetical protein